MDQLMENVHSPCAGGDCSHSAQCASSHFCHPEKKSCAPFCRSKSYEKSTLVSGWVEDTTHVLVMLEVVD
jgi:hypothetical protein